MRVALVTIGIALSVAATSGQQPGELIDRTLAIVGGQAITLSDVRAALSLGLLEDVEPDAELRVATERLIERTLVLREVQRYAPPEPSEESTNARVAAIASRFADADALRAAMAAVAFSDLHLRAWARDDLRIAAYIEQRFAAAGSAERRTELVRDWIADIRRRTPVVELIKPQAGRLLKRHSQPASQNYQFRIQKNHADFLFGILTSEIQAAFPCSLLSAIPASCPRQQQRPSSPVRR